MELQDLAAIATVIALVVSLVSIAFSAKRYLGIREREQEKERFDIYHALLKSVSRGTDEAGPLKLVSQIAYINELGKYNEYASTTRQALNLLRKEWAEKEPEQVKKPLIEAIDNVLADLQSRQKT
ncbi:hypothetical protein [Flexistipes sp.]|uniref:hypothetical protein n=1 Tax=Flexistipes sp. TaxID=3088135 RepID=UPI002E221D83|nr:hypothetical protein [Flexistipes sp.]